MNMRKFIIRFLELMIRIIDCFLEWIGMPITGPDWPPTDDEDKIEEKQRYK